MPSTPKQGRTLSATLKRLLQGSKGDQLKLGDLMDEIEADEGPGPLLFLLTLPVLLPTPPGVSMLLALPLLIVAPQIMLARRKLWIPKALAERTIERAKLAKLVQRILPPLTRMERLVRPRLQLLTGRFGASLVGVAATVIAIVLVLPLPAANLAPSLALALFSLGLS
ncbi:MAG TPA: exopolysaccharide biosynthesis protein, partial [Caulobacteraceae bacterium]|nr:exopolysaccharide biosynthesis protein [Caulobacteraceae bacterium]